MGGPPNVWFIREIAIMDDLGVALFQETPILGIYPPLPSCEYE